MVISRRLKFDGIKCIKIDSNNIPENFNVETFPTIILENGTKQINYDEYNKERTKENKH